MYVCVYVCMYECMLAVIKKASLITGGNLVGKVRLLDEEDAVRKIRPIRVQSFMLVSTAAGQLNM